MICVYDNSADCDGCMECKNVALHCELCGSTLTEEYYDIEDMLICPECISESHRRCV